MKAGRRDHTIQRRLSLAITLAVVLGFCLVGSILVPAASARRMDILSTDLAATGRILAHNLTVSVEFEDAADAAKILSSLAAKPSIAHAWILRGERVFASYAATGAVADVPAARGGEVNGRLYSLADITQIGDDTYQLLLADDLSGYRAGFWLDLLTLIASILVAFVVLILLTSRLARRISKPLSRLAEHAQRLSADETYSARIETDQGGEIATLFTAFDQMLSGIRTRDRQLVLAQAKAEVRAEEAERAREDLAISLHSIADAFLTCDAEGLVTRMNPIAEQMTGWSAAQAFGQPIDVVYQVRDLQSDARLEPAARAVLSLRGEMAGNPAALLVARDGRTTPVADHAAPMLDRYGDVVGAVLVARDMREQFELEERLRQGQKMEAIGQLAGGVAHDFNNLLTGILGYVDMILALPEAENATSSEVRGSLLDIRQAAERAADLTGQLLAFSRRGRFKREPVDVHEIVRATVGILQHTVGPKITMRLQLLAHNPMVVGDASQLQSAFLNLGVNARDAMPNGGVLTFATQDLAAYAEPSGVAGSGARSELPRLQVQVQDTGVGIDAQLIERIFEPFFTTKQPGQGTGLGLAAVYGTMESHLGTITVASELGRGTTFTCVLPASQETRAAAIVTPATAAVAQDAAAHGHLVLVADDEEMLRKVASNMLGRLGCEVLLANNGAQALDLFAQHHAALSMVLLDVHMPELDGHEAYARMRALDAKVPILMTTGSSIESDAFPGAHAENFMQKPYTFACLSAALERLVNARPTR